MRKVEAYLIPLAQTPTILAFQVCGTIKYISIRKGQVCFLIYSLPRKPVVTDLAILALFSHAIASSRAPRVPFPSETSAMKLDASLATRAIGYDINPGGTHLFALQVSFLVLAWISVVFRGYVRLYILKQVSSDDYLMFASVVSVD